MYRHGHKDVRLHQGKFTNLPELFNSLQHYLSLDFQVMCVQYWPAGKNREETMPIYKRLMTAVDAAVEDAETYPSLTKLKRTIDMANEILDRLQEYYGPV